MRIRPLHLIASLRSSLSRQRCVSPLILAAAVLAPAVAMPAYAQDEDPAAPVYEVVDLGTLGGELSNAFGINDDGVVVGRAETPNGATNGFVWRDGQISPLEGLSSSGSGTTAYSINNAGDIVGSSLAPDPQFNGRSSMPFYLSEEKLEQAPFVRTGTITHPSPLGVSITAQEFAAGCPTIPRTQGFDAHVFALPDVNLLGATAELTATNATGLYDLRATTYRSDCTKVADAADAASADLTQVFDAAVRYLVVATASGSDTTVTLTVSPAPARILNLGQDLTRTGTGTTRDVNEDGLAVGVWRKTAFTWHRDSGYAPLPFLPGAYWEQAEAMAVNDPGVAVGWGTDDEGFKKPVRWSADGTITELPVLPGGRYGVANDINTQGVVAGEADGTTERGLRTRPVLWHTDGTIEEIPLTPLEPPLDMGFAEGINDSGTIIGWDMSSAYGDGRQVGWIRSADGLKTPLNDLVAPGSGWDLVIPLDINERGQIVGIGILTLDGVEYPGRAFLLNPIGGSGGGSELLPTILTVDVEGRGAGMNVAARLTSDGAPVPDRSVAIYSDDILLGEAITDALGIARVNVPPGHRGNNRTYSARFAGDAIYASSTSGT